MAEKLKALERENRELYSVQRIAPLTQSPQRANELTDG
jgi:hypothetical protein